MRATALSAVIRTLIEARPIPLDSAKVNTVLSKLFQDTADALEDGARRNLVVGNRILASTTVSIKDVRGADKSLMVVVRTVPSQNEDLFQGAMYYGEQDAGNPVKKGSIIVNLRSGMPATAMLKILRGKDLQSIQGRVKDAFLHELTHASDILNLKGYVSPNDPVVSILIAMGSKAREIKKVYIEKSASQRDAVRFILNNLMQSLQVNGPILLSLPEDMRALAVLADVPNWRKAPADLKDLIERQLEFSLQDNTGLTSKALESGIQQDHKALDEMMEDLYKRYVNQKSEVKAVLQQFISQAHLTYENEFTTLAKLKKQERIPHLLSQIPIWKMLQNTLDDTARKYLMKALYQAFSSPPQPYLPLLDRLAAFKQKKLAKK